MPKISSVFSLLSRPNLHCEYSWTSLLGPAATVVKIGKMKCQESSKAKTMSSVFLGPAESAAAVAAPCGVPAILAIRLPILSLWIRNLASSLQFPAQPSSEAALGLLLPRTTVWEDDVFTSLLIEAQPRNTVGRKLNESVGNETIHPTAKLPGQLAANHCNNSSYLWAWKSIWKK